MKKFYFLLVALFVAVAANATDWYLVGANYGWNDNAANLFTDNGDGTQTLTVASLSGDIKIKEAGTWSTSFGTNGSKLNEGELYAAGTDTDNISVNGVIANAEITINPEAHTILVKGAAAENEYTDIYAVGDFGSGWSEDIANGVMIAATSANTFEGTLILTASTSYIKFKAGENVYGTGGGDVAVVSGETYTFSMSGKAYSVPAGEYKVVVNLEKNAETGTVTFTVDGDTPIVPEQPTVVYLMGIDGDWATGLAADVNAETNCATWTIDAWVAGTGFKFKAGSSWYGYTGDIVSGEWYTGTDTGYDNTTLPTSADGQAVTITYAADTNSFKVEWVAGDTPIEVPTVVYLMGLDGDWATGIAADVYAETNCATWTIPTWTAGSEFKFKVGDNWYGYTDAIVSGEWYEGTDTGMANCTLPESANGQEVVITFATDNNNFQVVWEAGETPIDPEYPAVLYLVGNTAGHAYDWAPAEAIPANGTEGVYTWENVLMEDASEGNAWFSFITVADESWDVVNAAERYGATYADYEVVFETPMEVLAMTGDAYSWKVLAGTYNMTLDLKNSTLVVSQASGISSINGDNAAAEYYTIQGVRVDNPTTGIYIVRRGNTVTKTYIK